MNHPHEAILKRYLQLPDVLEKAVQGLDEAGLDLKAEGWSIRTYVHHTVEGEMMWQLYLRAILGRNGIEFPIQWYRALSQDEWVDHWASTRRSIKPTQLLFRGSTASLVELLRNIDIEAWKNHGKLTWPGEDRQTFLSVRDIILMNMRHVNQHAGDILSIRQMHRGQVD